MPSIRRLIQHYHFLQWVRLDSELSLILLQTALQMELNQSEPVVWNTIQAFLIKSKAAIQNELSIAKENQFHYGVKLVRGAYIEGERALADQHNWPNPVWKNKELTDANYDDIAAALIGEAANSCLECVLAGHNEQSILLAIDRLNQQPGWSIYCLFCIPNCTNITCRTI